MDKTFGIIGCGKMGGTMLTRIIASKLFAPAKVIASDKNSDVLNRLKDQLGIMITCDNVEVAKQSDFLLLSVLPQAYPALFAQIKPFIKKDACVITIAPGFTIDKVAAALGNARKIVRAMPNTPSMIGEGMIAVCRGNCVDDETFKEACAILSKLGKTEEIEESQFNAVIGVSGSAPAYVYMFMQALADAGVMGGLHRDQALRFAAQAMLGSVMLQIKTGEHPERLKDMVCSPGGTTIAAVAKLEEQGFRSAVLLGAKAAMDKAKELA